jgi:hypothetical protein
LEEKIAMIDKTETQTEKIKQVKKLLKLGHLASLMDELTFLRIPDEIMLAKAEDNQLDKTAFRLLKDSMTKDQRSNLNTYMFSRDMDSRQNTIQGLEDLLIFMHKEGRRFAGENVTPPSKTSRSTSGSLNHVDTEGTFSSTKRGGLFKEAAHQDSSKRNRREEIPKRLAEDSTMAQEIAAVEFQNQQKELRAQEQDDTIQRAVQAEIHRTRSATGQGGDDLRIQLQLAQNQIKALQTDLGNRHNAAQQDSSQEAIALILNAINNGPQAKNGQQAIQGNAKDQQADTNPRRGQEGANGQQEECRNFKKGRCNYRDCRFLHADGQTAPRPNNGGN